MWHAYQNKLRTTTLERTAEREEQKIYLLCWDVVIDGVFELSDGVFELSTLFRPKFLPLLVMLLRLNRPRLRDHLEIIPLYPSNSKRTLVFFLVDSVLFSHAGSPYILQGTVTI